MKMAPNDDKSSGEEEDMKVLDDVVRNVPEKYKADVRQIFLDDEPSSAVLAGLVLPWTSLAVPRGLIENPAEQHSRYHTS